MIKQPTHCPLCNDELINEINQKTEDRQYIVSFCWGRNDKSIRSKQKSIFPEHYKYDFIDKIIGDYHLLHATEVIQVYPYTIFIDHDHNSNSQNSRIVKFDFKSYQNKKILEVKGAVPYTIKAKDIDEMIGVE